MPVELEVDNKTFRNAIKLDMKLQYYKKIPRYLLTTAIKKKE